MEKNSPVSVILDECLCPQLRTPGTSPTIKISSFCDPPLWGESEEQNDDDNDVAVLVSQLTDNQRHLFFGLEQRIRTVQQEAIRQRAMVLLYQDELRILTTQAKRKQEDKGFHTIEWKERRLSMRRLQDVMREHSALVALRAMTSEQASLKAIVVQGETKNVLLEIENQVLKLSLQEERRQVKELSKELNTLDMANRHLRAKTEVFGQRMAVAEQERNFLRRRIDISSKS